MKYHRSHRAAALFCLLAVVLLYAPMAAAAWPAPVPDCCKNGMCPMHMHNDAAAMGKSMPADCSRGARHMGFCSLSCCHNPDRAAVSPQIFLLPLLGALAGPGEALDTIAPAGASKVSLLSDPASPPPRSAPAVR